MVFYTIETPPVNFQFEEFLAKPDICKVRYTFELDNQLGLFTLQSWDEATRTFTFYQAEGLELFGNDVSLEFRDFVFRIRAFAGNNEIVSTSVSFTLRVYNPCFNLSQIAGYPLPKWCVKEQKPVWMPLEPAWMEQIGDRTIYVGQSLLYEFGPAVSYYDKPVNVTIKMGSDNTFSAYDSRINALEVRETTSSDVGYWKFSVIAQESRANLNYTYTRTFYLSVIEWDEEVVPPEVTPEPPKPPTGSLAREDLIKENPSIDRPVAYIHSLDVNGLMTIGWSHKMIPYADYKQIKSSSTIVKGEARSLMGSTDYLGSSEYDRIVQVRKNETEMKELARDTLELGAIEVHFVDSLRGELVELTFDWDVVDFTEKYLKLQLSFEYPELVSNGYDHSDMVVVTFWDTQYFKSVDGQETLFGSQLKWEVIR